jgi:nicotinate-nucleotide pyrophosphorylase
MSLSDTAALFSNHVVFLNFEEVLRKLKENDLVWDKNVVIEVDSVEKAVIAMREGFECIRADYLSRRSLGSYSKTSRR